MDVIVAEMFSKFQIITTSVTTLVTSLQFQDIHSVRVMVS